MNARSLSTLFSAVTGGGPGGFSTSPTPRNSVPRVARRRPDSLLIPPEPEKRPTPAPAWVALAAAWAGLVMLVASIVFTLLPGSVDPRAELEHARPYSPADRFLPLPIYGITVALFLGIVVLWQMRKEPRPLAAALAAQRVQAWVGIVLALCGAALIYTWVAFHGPR
jgi:hypothetical protein